jgi:hypothetical protein
VSEQHNYKALPQGNNTDIFVKYFHRRCQYNTLHNVSKARCFRLPVGASPEEESSMLSKACVMYIIFSDDGNNSE